MPTQTIQNLSTLKIHRLTQEQYDRESAAGKIDETAIYLTPDKSITIWQPDTEYKVGDVVIANLQEVLVFEDNLYLSEPSRTIIAKCIESHTSTTPFSLYNNMLSGNVWEILQETKAYYDALGRGIHNTYATKEELAEAIGQALEGDY